MINENSALYPITTTYKYNNIDYPIKFKSKINIAQIGALIQSIVSNIIDNDGYYPYLHDYSLYSGILSVFTDFDKTDILEIDTILKRSNIIDIIRANVPSETYSEIVSCVDETIDFEKQNLINKSEFDELISDIRKIVDDVNERFIKPADDKAFQKLLKNLSGLKLNEKSLVDALIKAKVIDKKFPEKESKGVDNGKVINFKGQQNFDRSELKEDELE